MKKFFENTLSIILGIAIIIGFTFMQENKTVDAATKKKDEFVYETFVITDISKDGKAINGDIIHSSSGDMGTEGIFLDNTIYKDYNIKKKLKKGDIVIVVFDKNDYDNQIWDNLIDVKVLKKMK